MRALELRAIRRRRRRGAERIVAQMTGTGAYAHDARSAASEATYARTSVALTVEDAAPNSYGDKRAVLRQHAKGGSPDAQTLPGLLAR